MASMMYVFMGGSSTICYFFLFLQPLLVLLLQTKIYLVLLFLDTKQTKNSTCLLSSNPPTGSLLRARLLTKKKKHISLPISNSSIYCIWLLVLLFCRNSVQWIPTVNIFSLVSFFILLDHWWVFLQKANLLESRFFWVSLSLRVHALAPRWLSSHSY